MANLVDFQRLANALRNFDCSASNEDKSQPISHDKATVIFSLLQIIDVSLADNAESEKDLVEVVNFIKDAHTLRAFHSEIISLAENIDRDMASLICIAWAVSLRVLSQNPFAQTILEEFNEDEEEFMEGCLIDAQPFDFLRTRLFNVEKIIFVEEFFYRRIHTLITQLIAFFPVKVKEWRLMAEQECKISKSGFMPTKSHYEQLLLLIGDFYKNNKLNLSKDFMAPVASNISKLNHTQVSLYKFTRTCSESIHHYPRLYVAYLHMLAGLCNDEESAQRCFVMMKEFGSSGHSSPVSLDHFFRSLGTYHQDLRRGSHFTGPPFQAPVVAFIAPEELRALQFWLRLIINITNHNSMTRIAFCENSSWSCVSNFFGLIACQLPLELKSLMMKFLASLAQSSELYQILCDGLLTSNILSHSPADGALIGLKQELDEVESRNETYPVSTALIEFLTSLVRHGNLAHCGDNALRCYMDFVFNSVAIQMLNRTYKNMAEKWALFGTVAEFFFYLLAKFEITPATISGNVPGAQLMLHLLSDGPIFRLVVGLIDQGFDILENSVPSQGIDSLEKTTLYMLKLILVALQKQRQFLHCLRSSNVAVLTASLDVLLRTLNPKSGEPDYIVKIMCYTLHTPEHSLAAVKIVAHLNSIQSVKSRLLKYFCYKQKLSSKILYGFTLCLNMDEMDACIEDSETYGGNNDFSAGKIRAQTALTVLELLIEDLRTSSDDASDGTSLAYFLLGFDMTNVKDSVLQNPGVNQTPQNCLHATMDIINSCSGANLHSIPCGRLIEPAYRLLYWLCAKKCTGEPTLRYLRSNYDFVFKFLNDLKFNTFDKRFKNTHQEIIGWLMKIAALELKSLLEFNQRSYINRILNILLDGEDALAQSNNFSIQKTSSFASTSGYFKLLELLNFIRIDDDIVELPTLKYLDSTKTSQLISTFTLTNAKQYQQCDVVNLHEILRTEATSSQATSFVGPAHLLSGEIDRVLECVVQYNKLQILAYVRRHTFDAWRQLTEIALNFCPLDAFNVEQRIKIISSTLIHVLQHNHSCMSRNVSSVVLTLTSALRRQFAAVKVSRDQMDVSTLKSPHFTELDEKSMPVPYASVLNGTFVRHAEMDSLLELKHLAIVAQSFERLLNFMTKSENKRHPISRALLYGSLMNFMRLTCGPDDEKNSIPSAQYPNVKERMVDDHRRILARHVTEIFDQLLKDECDGPEICRTLASICRSTILEQDFCDEKISRLLMKRGFYNTTVEF